MEKVSKFICAVLITTLLIQFLNLSDLTHLSNKVYAEELYTPYNLYNSSSSWSAVNITGSSTAGEKFSTAYPIKSIEVCCPSWDNNIGNLTLKLYKWNTDFNTSIIGTPLASQQFVNFEDNEFLRLDFQTQSAGEYLWVLSNPTETVGVYKYENKCNNDTAFFNGIETYGNYSSRIYFAGCDFRNYESSVPPADFHNYTNEFPPTYLFSNKEFDKAIQITGSNTASEKFTTTYKFNNIQVCCPSWYNNIGSLTLKLYKWNTDYSTTVSGVPIATQQFVNFVDNALLELNFQPQSEGVYLWQLSDPTETVGVYKSQDSDNTNTAFYNGVETTGDYQCYISNAPSKLYDEINSYTEINISGTSTAGEKFTARSSFKSIEVCCPSWWNNTGNLTLKMYKWNTDYKTTVSGEPIAVKQFINFNDNAFLYLDFLTQSAGDYLWQLSDPTETVGVYKYQDSSNSNTAFYNGVETTGDYLSRVYYLGTNIQRSTEPLGTKFTYTETIFGIEHVYHYDATPKSPRYVLNALLSKDPIYLANRNSEKDEPLDVLENYYSKNGPSFIRVLASRLLDLTVAYEKGGYERQEEYITASNYIRDMIKCTTNGHAALCNQLLASSPEEYGWEYVFIDSSLRIVCSDEAYNGHITSDDVQDLIASLDGYVEGRLYELDSWISLSMCATALFNSIQSVTASIYNYAPEAIKRAILARKIDELEKAVSQAEKDAIISQVVNIMNLLDEAMEIITKAGVSADDLGRWGVKSDSSIIKLSEFIKAGLDPKGDMFFYEWFNRSTMGFDELENLGIKTYSDLNNRLFDFERFGNKSLEHIFKGEINNSGELVGFHYEGYPNPIAEVETIIKPENGYNVYEATIKTIDGLEKTSTFFPKDWSPKQVMDAIMEAYWNRAPVEDGWEGISNGIKIRMYIEYGPLDIPRIKTAFPIYE